MLFPTIHARYRTATTSLPRLPFVKSFIKVLNDSARQVQQSIQNRAVEIIKYYHLASDENAYFIDIDMRETNGCPETAKPTVLIVFDSFPADHDKVDAAIKDIAKFAHDALDQVDKSAEPFHIEMIDLRLVQRIRYEPVQGRPDLLDSWEQLKGLVRECLEDNMGTKGHMTSINLFHYGLDEDGLDVVFSENPITIFITVDFDSLEFMWPAVINDIKQQLAKHHFPALYIHMEHNIGYHLAPPKFPLVPLAGDDKCIISRGIEGNEFILDEYSTVVSLGDSIGAAKYIISKDGSQECPGHGTLGCYVEIKTLQAPEWERYALTNYHVIRATLNGFSTGKVDGKTTISLPPPARCDLRKADEFGLAPGAHDQSASMESPPRSKHNYTIWDAKKAIENYNAQEQEIKKRTEDHETKTRQTELLESFKSSAATDMENKIEFFDCQKNILGKVYAASGYNKKTDENGRLDWALIKVNKARIGTNELPKEEAWLRIPSLLHPFLTFGAQLQPQTQSISLGHPNRCTGGFKLGTTTGATCGQFHEFKSSVSLLADRHLGTIISDEYVFQYGASKPGELFAGPGDSGSVVFDDFGGVIGLLFGGLRPNNSARECVYVTPIEHVFKHIKESSKGKITNIRVAQS
ncbi:hypothetical protein ACHAP5_006917 [Fusarium lateritium]